MSGAEMTMNEQLNGLGDEIQRFGFERIAVVQRSAQAMP